MRLQKAILVQPDEKRMLETMYVRRRTTIEQYEELPDQLDALTKDWNSKTGRRDLPRELLHYMRTRRKAGQWVQLKGKQRKRPQHRTFTAEETEILVDIYREHVLPLELGSDGIGYDNEISELIAREFAMRTNSRVPAHELIAKLTRLRKRGLLPKVGKRQPSSDEGFRDLDAV